MDKIQKLYEHIKSDSGLLTETVNRDSVFLDELLTKEEFKDLSLEEWKKLIHTLYFTGKTSIEVDFGKSELSDILSDMVDYDDPSTIEKLNELPKTPPRSKAAMVISPGQPFQGAQNSCFAHAAASMILRNVYKFVMSEPDKLSFKKNNCNHYLDTTMPLKNYASIETNCGVSGAKRILLYRYIYRVITNEYGCNYGATSVSVLYYLQASFQPVFPRVIGEKIRPEFVSKFQVPYSLSVLSTEDFTIGENKDFLMNYFKQYYAVIRIEKPEAHAVPCIGIDDEYIYCKDSSIRQTVAIPIRECHSKGVFMMGDQECSGITTIFLLFETATLAIYPKIVITNIVHKHFGPPKDFPAPIDFPEESTDARAAEESPRKEKDGGRKSRKRRKTRRKRTRKN